jgi:hypothetical protein
MSSVPVDPSRPAAGPDEAASKPPSRSSEILALMLRSVAPPDGEPLPALPQRFDWKMMAAVAGTVLFATTTFAFAIPVFLGAGGDAEPPVAAAQGMSERDAFDDDLELDAPGPAEEAVAEEAVAEEAVVEEAVAEEAVAEEERPALLRPRDGRRPRTTARQPLEARAASVGSEAFALRADAPRTLGTAAPTEERAVRARRAEPSPTSRQPLDAGAVRDVVRRQQPRLRQCYTRAVRRAGVPHDATVRLIVHVARSGEVEAVYFSGPDFGDLEDCLVRTAGRWTFPPSRSGGEVPIPLVFTAGR